MMSSMDDCLKVYFVSHISLCIVSFLILVSFVSVSRVGPCSRRAVIRQHLFVSWLGFSPCLLFYVGCLPFGPEVVIITLALDWRSSFIHSRVLSS